MRCKWPFGPFAFNKLIDRSIDWLIDWLIDWFTNRSTVRNDASWIYKMSNETAASAFIFLQCVTTMSITIWLGGGVPSAECHLVCSAAAAAAAVQYCWRVVEPLSRLQSVACHRQLPVGPARKGNDRTGRSFTRLSHSYLAASLPAFSSCTCCCRQCRKAVAIMRADGKAATL